ncbi:MAG: EAL domain-containing protein [Gammaproteobacteria bacterium]
MTLYRQLVLVILTLFVLLFMGTLLVNFHTTRTFLLEQLASHAQDTATSLGVSLSHPTNLNDVPTMTSLVDAIFDRGYYQQIVVENRAGQILVNRKLNVKIKEVPAGFVDWVELKAPQARAQFMSGWRQAGTVYVQSHTGYAYEQLWRTLTRTLFWFAATALLGILVGGLILRSLLKPLKAVERQAEAVSGSRYEIQETLPKTRELRNVVLAMNRMIAKIKLTFEEQAQSAEHLRVLAYRDPLTGIGNRRYFDVQLQARLKPHEGLPQGALLLMQINDLNGMNNRHGYQAGDAMLKQAVSMMQLAITNHEHCLLARLAGADFGLLIPDASLADAEKLAAIICKDLARLHSQGLADLPDVAHIGIAVYAGEQQPAALLAEADMALRTAQAQGPNTWYRYAASPILLEVHGKQEWKTYIGEVVRAGKVVLHIQPVVDAHIPETLLHNEVFARIPGQDNALLAARMFMPMAEQLDIAVEIDRAVLTQIIAHLAKGPNATPFAVNLSLASLRDADFGEWLFSMLAKMPGGAQRIEFEFAEFVAVHEIDKLRAFVTRLRDLGHGFGLDQFGRGFSAFGYLQSLRPDYVKIDGSYTEHVTQDRDNQFFLRTLSNVAHSLDIVVIAQAVESQEQWQIMNEINVDGVQGYAVGRPQPLQ